jgi:hypothetical protein
MVFEDLAVEVIAGLPTDAARCEVIASVEEIREALGPRCWVQYMSHAGSIVVSEVGWAG